MPARVFSLLSVSLVSLVVVTLWIWETWIMSHETGEEMIVDIDEQSDLTCLKSHIVSDTRFAPRGR